MVIFRNPVHKPKTPQENNHYIPKVQWGLSLVVCCPTKILLETEFHWTYDGYAWNDNKTHHQHQRTTKFIPGSIGFVVLVSNVSSSLFELPGILPAATWCNFFLDMTFTVGIQVFFTLPVASFSCSLFLAFARLCGNILFESPQVWGMGWVGWTQVFQVLLRFTSDLSR